MKIYETWSLKVLKVGAFNEGVEDSFPVVAGK